jgi:hypothetical protein
MPPAPSRHRALGLLANAGRDGVADGLMIANGVTVEQMVALVRAGLATATARRIRAGGKAMEVATLRITDAGQRANELFASWTSWTTAMGEWTGPQKRFSQALKDREFRPEHKSTGNGFVGPRVGRPAAHVPGAGGPPMPPGRP